MSEDASQIALSDALKLVHENARQNIESCKSRQWQVANYTLLAQAALVAVTLKYATHQLVVCVAAISLLALTAGSAALLTRLQSSQQSERRILREVRQHHFPERAREILGLKPRENFEGFWYHSSVLIMLYAVVIGAAAIGIIVVATQSPA